MATLNDLFGGSKFDDKRPPTLKWDNPGDYHDIIVTAEPVSEQQKEVGGSWDLMWLEKQPDGKWKPTPEGRLTEGRENYKLTQVVVFGKSHETGEDVVVYFDNKAKKDALASAMEKTDLSVGYGMRIIRGQNSGRSYTWEVKIAAPSGE